MITPRQSASTRMFISLLESGHRYSDIARIYGVSRQCVHSAARRLNLIEKNKLARIQQRGKYLQQMEERKEIAKRLQKLRGDKLAMLWNAGATKYEIADAMNIAPQSVGPLIDVLKKRGYDIRPRKPRKKQPMPVLD